MSTVLIIVLIAVVVAAVVAGALYAQRERGGTRGRSLRERFGPEYERVLARHDGDTHAADRELGERVRQYGTLNPKPLGSGTGDEYLSRWAATQERFVASPQQAVSEADGLLARLAADRGFPAADQHDQQFDALSVHYPLQVDGYRLVHAAALGQAGTEQMREAMVRGRALFDALLDEPAPKSAAHRNTPGGVLGRTQGPPAPSPRGNGTV